MSLLTITLLGPPQVTRADGVLVTFRSRKELALLAYLAVEHSRPQRREALLALFWPDAPSQAAQNSLRVALANLRRVLGPASSALIIDRQTVQFAPDGDDWLDVAALRALFNACERHRHERVETCRACIEQLGRAVDLYGGDFLAGFFLPDADPFEEWAAPHRTVLHQRILDTLTTLGAAHEATGDYAAMCRAARRQVALEPWHEPAHRQLMRGLARLGRRSAALSQYEQCCRTLADELGIEPDMDTVALAEEIRAGDWQPEATPVADPPYDAPITLQSSLPHPSTPLIGRAADMAAIAALIDTPGCRILTLVGPGGIGKTSLVLAMAHQLAEQLPEGIIFISLVSLDDPALVLPTIAHTFGTNQSPGQSLIEALAVALRQRPCLLVLDNFEHLTAAAPQLAELSAACPMLRLLITSRVVLRLRGERVYLVPPLALATPGHTLLEQIARTPAVRLFVERACAVRPDFALTPDNAETIARICALLDGLPLAIELAATRVRVLPPLTLLRRLEGSQGGAMLHLLTGGARDLPDRQHTLHDTIAWSYNLLPTQQRVLFRRLGVFRGGWSLEAAAALGNDIEGLDPLDGLTALTEQSLLTVREVAGEPRFDMLETIREYALERLKASGEIESIRRWHSDFFVTFVEMIEPELNGPRQMKSMDALEIEHDNLSAALRWSLELAPVVAARISGAIWRWYGIWHVVEGRAWLDAVIARRTVIEAGGGHVAKVLYGAGVLALYRRDLAGARGFLEQARTQNQERGDTTQLAMVLHDLGGLAQNEHDYPTAAAYYQESLALAQEHRQLWVQGINLYRLGTVLVEQDDLTRGSVLLRESLAIFRQFKDLGSEAAVQVSLAMVARDQGDYRGATEHARAGLRLYQRVSNQHGYWWALAILGDIVLLEGAGGLARAYAEVGEVQTNDGSNSQFWVAADHRHLALIAREAGDHERAVALLRERVGMFRSIGGDQFIIQGLEELAAAASLPRYAAYAAQLWGAADRARATPGHARTQQVEHAIRERSVARICAALGEMAWQDGWAAGQAMTLGQAMDFVLDPWDG